MHVENSTVGVINTGDVKSIDSVVTSARTAGNEDLATALTQFTEAVLQAPQLLQDQKTTLSATLRFWTEGVVRRFSRYNKYFQHRLSFRAVVRFPMVLSTRRT
jgi:hypothetical protein